MKSARIPADTYSLDDLNELSEGLGDSISSLLEGAKSWYPFLDAREKIEKLLSAQGIRTDEIFLNKEPAKGQVLNQALENIGHNLELAGRLHLL